jgi:hypothetical protein
VAGQDAKRLPATQNGDHIRNVVLDTPALKMVLAFAETVSPQVQRGGVSPQFGKRRQDARPSSRGARGTVDQQNTRTIVRDTDGQSRSIIARNVDEVASNRHGCARIAAI